MITTVCMNPSFDKTAAVEKIVTGDVNRLKEVRCDVGGKGVNVAVVLRRLEVDVNCIGCVGDIDESEFLDMLAQEEVRFTPFRLPGKIRTNLKICDLSSNVVTEFNEPGLTMSESQLEDFLQLLQKEAEPSRYVVLSGSLPAGCPDDTYLKCMEALRGKDCVLDTSGDSLLRGLKEKPFLIKPNLNELEAVMRKELRTLRSIRDAALMLIQYGARNVVVSMGKYGAMYTNGKKTMFSPALQVDVRSTVGAGDAMIGGIMMGLENGSSLEESLRYGVAAGAASVMTDGTQLIQVADFERLLPKVMLQEV